LRKLQRGSRVAVVSPASAAKVELIGLGVEHLRAFGYEPVVMPHALARGPLYYAGTSEERVADLHGRDLVYARWVGVGGVVAAAGSGVDTEESEGVCGV